MKRLKDGEKSICNICKNEFIVRKGFVNICSKECRKLKNQRILEEQKKKNGGKLAFNTEKQKETMRKKYGVSNPYQIKEVSNKAHSKEARLKAKDTMLRKYGKLHIGPTFKDNMLKVHGVENVSQTKEWKEKMKSSHYMKDKERRKDHPWFNKTKEDYSKAQEKITKTCLEKYGVKFACMRPEARNYHTVSRINKTWNEDIKGELEFSLDKYSYDIKKNDILIEIDPTYTHSPDIITRFPGEQKVNKTYHLEKTKNANKHNFRCIHIFDWDNKQKILNMFKEKQRLEARKLTLKECSIKECNKFLDEYHIQNHCRGQLIRLGLYHNEQLVQIMTFGKPRYNKNYDWELLRLCSHPDYSILGGAQRLFAHRPEGSIISYCDLSKFEGKVYESLGMNLLRITNPTAHWSKNKQMISEALLRQRGYDQLFGTNYGVGSSNNKLMLDSGWARVYDCGQAVYVI